MRRSTLWIASALLGLFAVPSAHALTITSKIDWIHNYNHDFNFDFRYDSDLADLTSDHTLVKAQVYWGIRPGNGQRRPIDLLGSLQLENEDVDLDLNATARPNRWTFAFSETAAESGLTFSDAILDSLLDPGSYGTLDGVLIALSGYNDELHKFFCYCGVIKAVVKLTFENIPDDPGGSGGEVPEPASLLVWTGLAGTGLLVRRRRKNAMLEN